MDMVPDKMLYRMVCNNLDMGNCPSRSNRPDDGISMEVPPSPGGYKSDSNSNRNAGNTRRFAVGNDTYQLRSYSNPDTLLVKEILYVRTWQS